jgi:hypothetical protein
LSYALSLTKFLISVNIVHTYTVVRKINEDIVHMEFTVYCGKEIDNITISLLGNGHARLYRNKIKEFT